MNKKYFGTDGIRGIANQYPLTPESVLRIAMVVGNYLRSEDNNNNKVIIGKDTRLSGYMIEAALVSGFTAVGMDVTLVGPMPTPAMSILTKSMRATIGVMISASHNHYQYNGLKFFNSDGIKLSNEIESKIEEALLNFKPDLAIYDKIGKAKRLKDETGRYIEYVKQTFPQNFRLDGFRIVVDCANGASYHIAPKILWELGAEVLSIGVNPNGSNINEKCGSTYPKYLAEEVKKYRADLGIALDGDADRVIICDEKSNIIDGDQIIVAISSLLKEQNKLKNNKVVVTNMSNLGIDDYLNKKGIEVIRSDVGDKNVLTQMIKHDTNFGGEQSGHIILKDYVNTGDGIMTALKILSIMIVKNQKASQILNNFTPLPQVNYNFYHKNNPDIINNVKVQTVLSEIKKELGSNGRAIIRKSGTEPLIRIMFEGKNLDLLNKLQDKFIAVLEKNI